MKHKFKTLLAGALSLMMLTACGASSSSTATSVSTSPSGAGSTAASDTAWPEDVQEIVDRGVLRVGVKNAVPGFGYQDPLTGEYSGMEIDLANLVADYLGVETEFTTVTAATRGELLDSGDIDCVLARAQADMGLYHALLHRRRHRAGGGFQRHHQPGRSGRQDGGRIFRLHFRPGTGAGHGGPGLGERRQLRPRHL